MDDSPGLRVAVLGLGHLGSVTAASVAAAGNTVVGLDEDPGVIAALSEGRPPVHEPGLARLIDGEVQAGRLSFTCDVATALRGAEVLWVSFDTPVDDEDRADTDSVRRGTDRVAAEVGPGTVVLVSSQVPVGFTARLRDEWRGRGIEARFAYSPENLRLGRAIEAFTSPARVILGAEDETARGVLSRLFGSITRAGGAGAGVAAPIEGMSIESAEMTKHALNAFLATSVSFANEIARLCERLGASAKQVERGLKSEPRIGPGAYLAPGAAFAGGTLARDVRYLTGFGRELALGTPLLEGVLESNQLQKDWIRERLTESLAAVASPAPAVALLGLAYKPGTDSVRRSESVALCRWLLARGVRVRAHDPAVSELPAELDGPVDLVETARDALTDADVAVIATEWPEYRELGAEDFLGSMRRVEVVDQNWFLAEELADTPLRYVATGLPRPTGGG